MIEKRRWGVFDSFDKDEYTKAATPDMVSVHGVKVLNKDGTEKTKRHPGAFTSTEQTPYEKSGAAEWNGAEEYASKGDALFNDRPPHYAIKHQKPEHRIVILLKAGGSTNKEIAGLTGLSPVSISNILRQPWARQQLADEINSAGRNEVVQTFKAAALDVAEAMVEIVKNPESRSSDKISAGHLILDRLFGKPTQPLDVNLSESSLKTMSDDELLKIATGNNSN